MYFARYPLAAATCLALLLLGLSVWPVQRQAEANIGASVPDFGEVLTLAVDYPRQVRLGAPEELRLTTRVQATAGSTAALVRQTQVVANLESTCTAFDPPGEVLQKAAPGQPQAWHWQLSAPGTAGPCKVDLELRLRRGTGEGNERLVWVRTFTVTRATVLGLAAPAAEAIGLAGSVIGLLLLAAIQIRARSRPEQSRPVRRH